MAVTILLAAILLQGCTQANSDAQKKAPDIVRPVKTVCLEAPLPGISLRFPANVQAVREVDLAFRVSGPLVALNFDVGDKVEKGRIIARIDSRDFKVRIKALEAALEKSKASQAESRFQYDRHAYLVKKDVVPEAKYDEAKALWEMAVAQVKADRQSLRDARNQLNDTFLRAPFTGYLNMKYVENFEAVAMGHPIVSLVDMSVMEIKFGIPEDLIRQVDRFTDYKCRFDAVPDKTFDARFKEVGKKPGTSNQTYPLTLILDEKTIDMVRDGMAGQVDLTLQGPDKGENRFCIPAGALVNPSGQTAFVWVLDPSTNTLNQREVTTYELSSNGIMVKGDLSPGDCVVVAGASLVKPGQAAQRMPPVSTTNIGNAL